MVKKVLKVVVLVAAVIFIALQFYRPDQTDPPENPAEAIEASMQIPEDVRMILGRSCADCHSNRTVYPWYSNVSPFSWYLDNHIRDGRGELNISIWNTYETRKKIRKLDEICEQVRDGQMPLSSYLWIHWDAALKPGEADALCRWTDIEKERLQGTAP